MVNFNTIFSNLELQAVSSLLMTKIFMHILVPAYLVYVPP